MQPGQPRHRRIARGRERELDRMEALVQASFAVRIAAMEVLDAHRVHMERSRVLLRRAQELCARLDARGAPSPAEEAVSAPTAPPAAAEGQPHCMMSGCPRPSPFRPCFVVSQGIRRILVSDMPVRVCSEHRADLDALLQRPAVLDKLRRKLRMRACREPDAVHVLFEVVN